MTPTEKRNRQFLTDLFAGPFRGHAILVSPEANYREQGDFTLSDQPVSRWVGWYAQRYESRLKSMLVLDDDCVPYVGLNTNTGLFAAAFGCPIHEYRGQDTNAAARPIVKTAEEAARLAEPSLDAPTLSRALELTRLLRRELGPEASIGVPDVQSPFDIAALIWNKEDLFPALIETPEAVKELVGKCHRLVEKFLSEFKKQAAPEANLCHCPYAWAPAELGMWLSEDEAGALSTRMFGEFCLPSLVDLSRTFGGLFLHCCANADHQYQGFRGIPGLRGLNRVFQQAGPRPAIEMFSGTAVFMQAWGDVDSYFRMLDLALPRTRFLFNLGGKTEEVRAEYERLRARCPRS